MLRLPLQRLTPVLLFAAAMLLVQLGLHALGKEYCLTQLTMAIYYSLVVMGLCLVMGYAGQVSLGHGAFFALGGYTSAILTTCDLTQQAATGWIGWLKSARVLTLKENLYGSPILTVAPWAAFVAAMAVTLLVACLIGYPALRLKGHYLAMATLGFGLIVNKIILGSAVAGGADGITGVPAWKLAGGLAIMGKSAARVSNYYIAGGLALLILVLLGNLVRSRVGRAFQAIHDRETAANAMGINTAAYKLKAFVLSALIAAIAGIFFAHYTGGISPSEASAMKSVRYVALAAAGGMANLWGVTIMSILINYLSLRGYFGSLDNAVFGALLIVIISLAPEGPLKPLGLIFQRLFRKIFKGAARKPTDLASNTGQPHPSNVLKVRPHKVAPEAAERATGDEDAALRPALKTPALDACPMAAVGTPDEAPANGLLEVAGLGRRFGGLVAVNQVSFKVKPGQIKSLIGPNGAGKTTLFNLISGVLKADSGCIRFKGQLFNGLPPYQIARAGVSRTFQNPSLFLKMSVLENVMVGRHWRTFWEFTGCSLRLPGQLREEGRIRVQARERLDFVGLGALADYPANALAFGQLRMVELARALATEPDLLLLDEPASGLNTREKQELGQLITKIRDTGVTILLVEHDMSLVMDISDEILVLHNGTLLAEGPPAAIQNDPQVISVYLGACLAKAES